MKLADWLREQKLTFTAFAARIDVSPETVRRYAAGERIPEREVMPRIVAETDGKVQANDFYATTQAAE